MPFDTKETKTALIAGASRGLGLGITEELARRGWRVIATYRGSARTKLHDLAEGRQGAVVAERLDVTEMEEIRELRRRLEGTRLDLLLANAGLANRNVGASMAEITDAEYARLMATNALGPVRVLELMEDLVAPKGVMAAMTSTLGSMTENAGGSWPAYASSKAALNMLLHAFAARRGRGRAVVAMAPGWVRTDMGGPGASLSIEESVPRVIDVLGSVAGKPGLYYLNYDGRTLRW